MGSDSVVTITSTFFLTYEDIRKSICVSSVGDSSDAASTLSDTKILATNSALSETTLRHALVLSEISPISAES